MRCLVLNRNPTPSSFDDYLARFGQSLTAQGHRAEQIDLRDLEVGYCIGCWWSSPLVLGTLSALTKTVQDRVIPLLHPYIELVDGECHHRFRYQHNADLGLIVGPTADDTEHDVALTRRFFERFSRNTRTRLRLFATTATPVEEAVRDTLAA